jgi:hypothetical protein
VATFSYATWRGGPETPPSRQYDRSSPERLRNCPHTARPPVHWHALSCSLDLSERAACPVAFGSADLGSDLYHHGNVSRPDMSHNDWRSRSCERSEQFVRSPARCAHPFLLPRAHPRERINEAQRNGSREGKDRAPQAKPRSGVATFSYAKCCAVLRGEALIDAEESAIRKHPESSLDSCSRILRWVSATV